MNTTLLSRLRRARWVHAVQLFVFATWVMNPFPGAFSYWTDSNGDGIKEEVANPAEGTSWWDQDADGDNLTNAQEALFGSDPYSIDSDHDGLRDDAEQQLSDPTDPFDPWNWDSNGNGFSDYDEYYQRLWSYQPVVNYSNLTAGNFFSYSDADGDGVNNPEDSDPLNMDRDGDGIWNWNDIGYMDDPNNGYVPPPENDPGVWIGGNWYPSGTLDSDGDGTPDMSDPFPYGSYWYNGTEYGGTWNDRDYDNIPDDADPFPDGSYWWNGQEYGGTMSDQDGDSLPDWADPWPGISGSFWYNGTEYPGSWNDQDGDGIPDAADPTPDGSYWWNGTEYYGAWVDQDGDGTPDPFDPFPTQAGSYWYNGIEYAGTWIDSDSDGIPDGQDATPNGGYWYNGIEYAGTWIDSDSDGIPDGQDATPYGGYWYNGVEYSGSWSDVDNDGVPDAADWWPWDWWNGASYFSYNGTDYAGVWIDRDSDTIPDPADAYPDDPENNADNDNDGLSNYAENTEHGTDPNNVDTDGDFLTDSEELYTYHTNPLAERTDPNQLYVDYYMVDQTDTDGDSIPDRIEQWYADQGYGMSANDPNDALGDLDGDSYSNRQAYQYGWSFIAHTDQYDNDADGILDVLEDAWSTAYPGILSSGNFNDAVQDYDGDGLMNFEEVALGLNPGSPNSRSGNVTDLQEWAWRGIIYGTGVIMFNDSVPSEWNEVGDTDHTGAPDGLEAFVAALTAVPPPVTLPQRQTTTDYDGDGMPDLWEYRYHLNLRDAQDAQENLDGDTLTNIEEFEQGRNPLVNDDPQPPQIVTQNLPDGTVNNTYTAALEAVSGIAPYSFTLSSGSLPEGLSLASDGTITGTPVSGGVSTFTVSVTDFASLGDAREFTLNIAGGGGGGNPPPPMLTLSGDVPEGKKDVAYIATFTASGGMEPYSYSLDTSEAGLPDGLSLDPETGILSGTPTTAGSYTFSLQAADSDVLTGSASFSLTVTELEIATETLPPGGAAGTPYSAVISARYGTPPYAFGVVEREGDSGLPAGYVFQSNGALISTAEAVSSPPPGGTYTFTVQVTDDLGMAAERQLSLVLEAASSSSDLRIATLFLPDGLPGSYFSASVTATGGTAPYQFSGGGSGLEVSNEGMIIGTLPAEPGAYTVLVSVSDQSDPPATASAELTLVVKPPPPPPLAVYGSGTGPYSASGGSGGYRWGIVWDGDIPGGQGLDPVEGQSTSLFLPPDSANPGSVTKTYTGFVIVADSDTNTARTAVSVDVQVDPENPDPPPSSNDLVVLDEGTPEGEEQPTNAPDESHEVNSADGTGSRYRKVGLNGSPLPDGKPQSKDESGEVPEETYIDAYSSELRHGVSDIYVSPDSSLLPLSVRRDVTDDVWSQQSGMQPHQRPDRPFGMGWTSNLCATVRIEGNGTRATVTDEQGASHSFYRVEYPSGWSIWRPAMGAAGDVKSRWNSLQYIGTDPSSGGTFIYTKAFGSRCTYQYCTTRTNGSNAIGDFVHYFRLAAVTDRLENTLVYEYPGQQELIPSRIADTKRPGHAISIVQDLARNVVTQVVGPDGDITDYTYSSQIVGQAQASVVHALTTVTRRGAGGQPGTPVQYRYNIALEDTDHWHAAVDRITDELGREYTFTYGINNLVRYVLVQDGWETVFTRNGMPRLITSVTLPDGGVTQFNVVRDAVIRTNMAGELFSQTTVTGPTGQTTYRFTLPYVEHTPPPSVESGIIDPYRDTTLSFTQMDITSAAGTEHYSFNPGAGMALASATDVSGNTTNFTYDGANFDDPIRETDALGNFKDFTYEPTTRVMASMTDQTRVKTEYTVEPYTGLKLAETVRGAGGIVERQSTFEYNHPTFKGFMTKSTVDGDVNDTAPPTVTTYALGTGDEGWLQVTETVQTAAGPASTVTLKNLAGGKHMVTDPRGKVTVFTYDSHHRLTHVTHSDNSHKDLAYDAHGNLVSETNENGVSTFHEYDLMNRRVKTTLDLNGNGVADATYTTANSEPGTANVSYDGDIVTTTTYNARGQVATQTDARGKVTTHTYDDAGRLITTLDGNLLTSFDYSGPNSGGSVFDSSGFKPTQITDPRGAVTTLTYDAMYRTTAKTVSAGGITATTSTEYDAAGRPTRVTDPLGRVTLTVYDVFGQIQRVVNPDNTQVSTDYTHHGKPWKVIDEAGNLTKTEFDTAGRAVRTIAPAVDGVSAITQTQYDAAGNAVRVTDPLGRVTDTQYDDRNRAVSVQAPPVWDALAGASVRPSTQTSYDALGQVLTVTDAQGNVTTKHYDRAGRNWKVEAPAVQGAGGASSRPTTLTQFDPGGLALSVTNPLGQTVTNTYDTHGRLITTVDAENITNTFAYDAAGNRTSVKDGKQQETTFVYDGFNRLTSQTFANGDTTSFTYNAVQKLSQTSPRGITTTYTYDVRDRVTATSAPGLQRNHSYDVAGRLLSVSEPANPAANVSYTYDVLGRVLSETSRGITHSYSYDIAGNRTQASYGTGRVVQTSYDALNRPESLVEGGRTTSYGYDLGGRAVILKAGNGQTSRNVYDELGRLKQRTLFRTQAMTAGDELAQFAWTHDLLGNVTSQSETWPGEPTRPGVRTTSMAYDANNRLTHETIDDPSAGVTATAYAYDAANNRVSKQVTGGSEPGQWTYAYNAANQLTSWEKQLNGSPVKTAALTYDAAGNRIAQTVQEYNPDSTPSALGSTLYSWDAQDRLSSVTMPDGSEHAYKYDYRTRRISATRSGGTLASMATAILFAGGLSLAEWEVAGSVPAMANTPAVEYTRGPDMGGGVGGMLYSLRGGAAKYSLSNGRGDIVAQADQGANLTWTASYEAYGKRTKETGINQDKQRANSKDEDPTGLLNEGFRYRDIETGVWLSRDPAGFVDGPNLYAYVMQNPWTGFDPDGLFVSAILEKLDEHIFTPVGEAIGGAIASTMSADTLVNVTQNSQAFAATGQALNGVKSASMTALNTLSPFDDAAKAALNGDVKGALMEAGKEVAGGKFAKIGGKVVKAGGAAIETMVKKTGDNMVASAQKNADEAAAMVQNVLPNNAPVVRGGSNTPEAFRNGSGVTVDGANGKMDGVSVNSKAGATVEELSEGIPHNKVGVTTVGDVRKAGGDVVPSPTPNNPNHATMSGVTPAKASDLMEVRPNPAKKKSS